MLNEKEKIEYKLLDLLADASSPIGSVTLSLMLKEQDLEVSSATIGRVLSAFDRDGITEKHGFKGRLLTQEGHSRFEDLRSKKQLTRLSANFHASVDAESKDNLIDVLVARRGIEQESARLAALNITEEELHSLQKVYTMQAKEVASGTTSADSDVLFHRIIGKAGKNKVLLAAYDFIWQHGRFSPVMEYMRSSIGSALSVDHGKVLRAIANRNPDEAAKYMLEHIDNLIKDVHKYWDMAHKAHK